MVELLHTMLAGWTVRGPGRPPDVASWAILHSPNSVSVHKIESSVIFLVFLCNNRSINWTFCNSVCLLDEIAWLSAGGEIHEILAADYEYGLYDERGRVIMINKEIYSWRCYEHSAWTYYQEACNECFYVIRANYDLPHNDSTVAVEMIVTRPILV